MHDETNCGLITNYLSNLCFIAVVFLLSVAVHVQLILMDALLSAACLTKLVEISCMHGYTYRILPALRKVFHSVGIEYQLQANTRTIKYQ